MANKSFLLGISFLVGFCYVIYLAYDSNTKLRAARERADYAKHEYETLSVQVQQLLDQKAKLEKQLQSERNELRKVKEDKDYIEQQRKDLFSKLQEFTQTEKTLKAQQADLKQALEVANRELSDLRAEKASADQRNQAEFAQLGTQKDLEITKLRDQLADLKRKYDEARASVLKHSKQQSKRNQPKPAAPVPKDGESLENPVPNQPETGNEQLAQTNNEPQQKDDTPKTVETAGQDTDKSAGTNPKIHTKSETKQKDIPKRSKKEANSPSRNAELPESNNEEKQQNNDGNNEVSDNAEKTPNDEDNQPKDDQQLPKQVQPPVNVPAPQQNQLNPPVPVNDPNAGNGAHDNANNQQEPPPVDQVNNDDAEADPADNKDTNGEVDAEPEAAEPEERAQNQANQEAEKLHDDLAEVDDKKLDEESPVRSQRRRRSN